MVWYTLKKEWTHNSTLHLEHLYLILQYLFLAEHMWYHMQYSFCGQCSLYCTSRQLIEGAGLSHGVVWYRSIFPLPCIMPLFNVILKSQRDNFLPEEFKYHQVQEVEKQFLCPPLGLSANGITHCHVVTAVCTPHVYYSFALLKASEHFHAHHRNYLLLEDNAYSSTCLCPFCPSILITVKLPLTLVFISTHFSFILFPISSGMPFRFDLTVPQLFMVLLCKPSNKSGEEKKRSIYSLLPTILILELSPVPDAWVALTVPVTFFLSFPKYTITFYVHPLESQNLYTFIPNCLGFFGIYCWKWPYPWKALWFHQLLYVQLDCNI